MSYNKNHTKRHSLARPHARQCYARSSGEGYTAHDATGASIVGIATGGASIGYTVTFKIDTNNFYVAECLVGDTISVPPTPTTPTGYNFNGWVSAPSTVPIAFPYTPTGDINLIASFTQPSVIGFTGLTNSSGVLTWTDDIAGLSGYTTSTSGNLVTVSNASLDNRFPYSQITEMTDSSGNVLVKYPQMYMSWVLDGSGNIDGVKFANYQPDSTYFISDAFMQYGDTTYSKFNDYFALGKYEASGVSTRAYSASGQNCLVSITRAKARTACMANGSTYQQLDLAQFTLYNFFVYVVLSHEQHSECVCRRTSQPSASVTGTCDGITGLNGWNTGSTCVKMLGIENPYGNVSKWCDGIVFSTATIYAQRLPLYYSDTTSAIGSSSIGFSRPTTGN